MTVCHRSVVCLVALALVLAATAAQALTVEIVEPASDPAEAYAEIPTVFAAVVLDANQEDVSGSADLLWDFGTGCTSKSNPIPYAFPDEGDYTVTVTASYQGQQAQDTVGMQVYEAPTRENPLDLGLHLTCYYYTTLAGPTDIFSQFTNYDQGRDELLFATLYIETPQWGYTAMTQSWDFDGTVIFTWDASQMPNPSYHRMFVQAVVRSSVGMGQHIDTLLDSRDAPPYGDGHWVDTIALDMWYDRIRFGSDQVVFDTWIGNGLSGRSSTPPQWRHSYKDDDGNPWSDRDDPICAKIGSVVTVETGWNVPDFFNTTARYNMRAALHATPVCPEHPTNPRWTTDPLTGSLAVNNHYAAPVTLQYPLTDYVSAALLALDYGIEFYFPERQVWVPWPGDTLPPYYSEHTQHSFYLVLDDPNGKFPTTTVTDVEQSFAKITTNLPWMSVIQNAVCHASLNYTDPTVAGETAALANIEKGLYSWPAQPPGVGQQPYTGVTLYYLPGMPPKPDIKYNLTGMSFRTKGDCTDFSAYFCTTAGALGVSWVQAIYLGTPTLDGVQNDYRWGGPFYLKPHVVAGSPMVEEGFFDFHKLATKAGGIYDWCLAWPKAGGGLTWSEGSDQPDYQDACSAGAVAPPGIDPTWGDLHSIDQGACDPMLAPLDGGEITEIR